MNLLSTNEAAKILGVSGATVRNWCKAGHVQPCQYNPLRFTQDDIAALRDGIKNNDIKRLRKRANKTAAGPMPLPIAEAPEMTSFLAALATHATEAHIRTDHIVYCAALRFLQKTDEVSCGKGAIHSTAPATMAWRRGSIKGIMARWQRRLSSPVETAAATAADGFQPWMDTEDCLGVLHQNLSPVGNKARTGAYFTPGPIIDASLSELGMQPETFLDPCCGTGRYLLRAARLFDVEPRNLFGFDLDPVAVDIASINLLHDHPDWDFIPRIRCLDSLTELANGSPECDTNTLLGAIDAIATNPPWGGDSRRPRAARSGMTTRVRSGESFSLFLEKSLTLLRPGGRMSFVLPESMLKIKTHADVRRLLLDHTSILKITMMGRVFAGVFTPIMRLDAEKNPAPDGWQITVATKNGTTFLAPQQRFADNAGHSFDVTVSPVDERLLHKLFAVPHQTLTGQAEWALGIVTGDNSRYLLHNAEDGAEPVLRGRDVFPFYTVREPRWYIRFTPKRFQQVAPERFYRAPEKLVYRFVSDRLVFAYDNRQTLTLNSANIVIPRLPGLSIKATLAFFNSQVFQYIFAKRFRTRKILRGDLETLPFPLVDAATVARLEAQVDKCMEGDYETADALDSMVYRIFGLTADEVAALRSSLAMESPVDYQ